MTISGRMVKGSRLMSNLALAGACFYLLAEVLAFLTPDLMNAVGILEMHHTGMKITSAIPFSIRLEALAIELIPTTLVVWALWELHKLFRAYMTEDVFSQAALSHLRRVATLMFWFVPVSFFFEAPITYVLSLSRLPGHREVSLTLTSYDISFLFMAGVLAVIARVMAEARRVADENASFV